MLKRALKTEFPSRNTEDGNTDILYIYHFVCLYARNSLTAQWQQKPDPPLLNVQK